MSSPDLSNLIERASKQCECCGATYFKHPTKPKAKWALQRFCSAGCASKVVQQENALSPDDMMSLLAERSPQSISGCWEYSMGRDASGYALLKWAGKRWTGHRLMYHLRHRGIPEGMQVLHRCDNRICVNPAHLFLGDNAANNEDRNKKGRQAKGERIHTALLTDADVLAIRASDESPTILAARFGVSKGTIGNVRSGRRWRHLLPSEISA